MVSDESDSISSVCTAPEGESEPEAAMPLTSALRFETQPGQ